MNPVLRQCTSLNRWTRAPNHDWQVRVYRYAWRSVYYTEQAVLGLGGAIDIGPSILWTRGRKCSNIVAALSAHQLTQLDQPLPTYLNSETTVE